MDMKRHLIISGLMSILLIVLPLSAGCGGADTLLLSESVIPCLMELHNKALTEINAEIADLDKQIAEIEKKETNLGEIKTIIDNWVSYLDEGVAEEELKGGMAWVYSMPEEELGLLTNESYQLVKFEVEWLARSEGWKHFRDILIMDKETGTTNSPELFEKDLNTRKSELVPRRTAKSRTREECSQVMTNMLEHKDVWETKEIDNNVYLVSGYGLGYTEQLCVGEWYYYEDSKTIEPRSSAAIKLKDIITGGSG